MYLHRAKFAVLVSIVAGNVVAGKVKEEKAPAVLWQAPKNISSRDLFYGSGGKQHAPTAAPFVFVEEDRAGSNPKFVVKDNDGVKWKVKLGSEARPETAATRLLWAVGYSTDEDYFMPAMRVQNMPAKLRRGSEYVSDGIVRDARWERMDHHKLGLWHWDHNPFTKTRELDGLRVLMSLLNNYDLKDSQNSIYKIEDENLYLVSDLGATFGKTGSRWPGESIKGDLSSYSRSDFIIKVTKDHVDFAAPSWPMMGGFFPVLPLPYNVLAGPVSIFTHKWATNVTDQRWIGKGIPIEHVQWIAGLLGQLSSKQIRDMFRAAHYSPSEVEGFSAVVETRIAELKKI